MITLERALEIAKMTAYENKEKFAIRAYIEENGLEGEYISLISELAESRVRKLDSELRQHHWLQFGDAELFDKCYNKKLKPETAKILSEVQRRNIMGISNEPYTETLKEICKDIDTPQVYWVNALVELHKLGVVFKDDEKYTYTDNGVTGK